MKGTMLLEAVESVTDPWRKQRKKEERGRPEVRARRRKAMYCEYEHSTRVTIKKVAYECMEAAYMKASAGGTLPAHARQIMYAARPTILAKAQDRHGETPELDSKYFTQGLLPDYMSQHPDTTASWDVVFDARGHLIEPHTKEIVPLGTLDVRGYLRSSMTREAGGDVTDSQVKDSYPTRGPENRFGALLFLEKEGFFPLLQASGLAKRYDVAVMSTKGMSVVAARMLVENVCGTGDVPLLLLRDFDKSGFAIAASFQKDTRRYQFSQPFDVVDLGLRLEDVQKWNLVSEDVHESSDPRQNLAENGATPEEIKFLCEGGEKKNYYGKRVELNAFGSGDFIKWVESKLDEQGVKKIVPDKDTLREAYARAVKVAVINGAIDDAKEKAEKAAEEMHTPKTLGRTIRKQLEDNPTIPWDRVVAEVAARNCKRRNGEARNRGRGEVPRK